MRGMVEGQSAFWTSSRGDVALDQNCRANRSQRVVRRHEGLRAEVAEHRSSLSVGTTHRSRSPSESYRWRL
jgi:hypothetical protein